MCGFLQQIDWGTVPDWLAVLFAGIAAVVAWLGLRHAGEQAAKALAQSNKTAQEAIESKKLDYFTEYSKRYNELVLRLPIDFSTICKFENGRFLFNQDNSWVKINFSEKAKVIGSLFNLFSDEHYLYESGLVHQKVWSNWLDGIKMCLEFMAFQAIWEQVRNSSIYGNDYRQFIDEIIEEIKTNQQAEG